MDVSVQRLLSDKIYDRRKQGALELEGIIREALSRGDYKKIGDIVNQLCNDYAYATHQSHARNGGLIGLAAAAIALGSDDVGRYLKAIVPPVLACFTDQDARVRYYACESMYNIAKVAKGEILVFFNDVFDALCKLAADSELSVKNGAELLDRLVKDIVSESASTYISQVASEDEQKQDRNDGVLASTESSSYPSTAFSLPKFIPLLKERIYVINPFTRTFLVSWVILLDSIPDLELVTYLPDFLGGLFKFLNDSNRDVHVATQGALERFLNEVKKIAKIKRDIVESRKSKSERKLKHGGEPDKGSLRSEGSHSVDDRSDEGVELEYSGHSDDDSGDWIPGQDTPIDYPRILEILVTFLDPSSEEEVRLTSLRWIDTFFDICPGDILPFVPKLLSYVLPAMASTVDHVRQTAHRVNASLMDYMSTLPDENNPETPRPALPSKMTSSVIRDQDAKKTPGSSQSNGQPQVSRPESGEAQVDGKGDEQPNNEASRSRSQSDARSQSPREIVDLDYAAAVGALTLHFLAEHEATRVAALNWLILLHRKAPRKVLATNDGTFPALLKTLSDPDEAVVTKDLQLLAQISRNSDDSYFTSFIENVLQLFATDRRLLEQRGNLIIRQLCSSLNAERIYRTVADCLEKEEDLEFAMVMVQSLNNNLITAPQLTELRKRLRTFDSREGQTLFVTLFKSWCYNAVATFSLCLLAQAYEQAYQLLQIMGDMEMTVQMLIEIDKLVQLLESPVFTYLRLQLLESDRFPYLYKCLYGVLMLLPQSAAFAALKNRLNSVSAIGFLHVPPRPSPQPSYSSSTISSNNAAINASNTTSGSSSRQISDTAAPRGSVSQAVSAGFPTRLKPTQRSGEEAIVRWPELLDKFRMVQERGRRARKGPLYMDDERRGDDDGLDGDETTLSSRRLLALPGAREVPGTNNPAAAALAGRILGAQGHLRDGNLSGIGIGPGAAAGALSSSAQIQAAGAGGSSTSLQQQQGQQQNQQQSSAGATGNGQQPQHKSRGSLGAVKQFAKGVAKGKR